MIKGNLKIAIESTPAQPSHLGYRVIVNEQTMPENTVLELIIAIARSGCTEIRISFNN